MTRRKVDLDRIQGIAEDRRHRVNADGSKHHDPNVYISTLNGVSIPWLADAFELSSRMTRKKLKGMLPKRYIGEIELYDFKEAANRLATLSPEMMANMEPKDLPPKTQKAYYDAQLQRVRYEERAGNLWHTEDVVRVFGEVFKNIKHTTQMWIDSIDKVEELSPKQIKALQSAVDGLLFDMKKSVDEMQDKNQTLSALGYEIGEEED